MSNQSEFVRHEPCPKCGSKDNLARYTDGHGFCFGCNYKERGDGLTSETAPRKKANMIDVTFSALRKRMITEETCRFFGYGVGEFNGQSVQVAQYYKDGEIVAQKLRFPSKDFVVLGDIKEAGFYGQQLWRDSGKMVTITEGEIDALSISQVFNNKWPVVSVPNGAAGAVKSFQKNLEWLESFESVHIMFDDDEPGRKAARECALLLTPGKAKIGTIPGFKDANEALQAGHSGKIVDAVYGAKTYRPDGVVVGSDLWDTVIAEDATESTDYPWNKLNEKLLGIRRGELVVLTSGTGIGKSSVCRELICHLIRAGKKVGLLMLEESVKRTSRNLMGIHLNCPPYFWERTGISEQQKREAFDATVSKVVMFDHFGSVDPENLLARVRYMTKALGCEFVFLDHLSIVVSGLGDGDERRLIDNAMTSLRSLVEETQIALFVVSHLKRPEGDRGHENGAQTTLAQLRGSHAIAQLADAVIGLERNQQDEENANLLSLRVLKNRFTGETGLAGGLRWYRESGRLAEVEELPVNEDFQ
jgi:twinkle protein